MQIRNAQLDDMESILHLWKQTLKEDGRCLAIPFKSGLQDLIERKQFIVCLEQDKIIAFGGYKPIKRKNIIKIVNLCVDKAFRKHKIGIAIVKRLIEMSAWLKQKYVVECQEGAENNTFWLKYGTQIGIKECKTMNVRIILLKDNIIRRMYI